MRQKRSKRSKMRTIRTRLPSGKVRISLEKRKPGRAKCVGCGAYLHGTTSLRKAAMQHMPKSEKRPERPYGGVLCSACMRKKITEAARSELK